MSMWRLVSWKFYLVSTVNSIALFQCKDGSSPRKDLDTCDASFVVIMMERVLRSTQRTVPRNLTPDVQVAGKTFLLRNPQTRLAVPGDTEHFGHPFDIRRCCRNVTVMWSKGGGTLIVWELYRELLTIFKNHVTNVPFLVYKSPKHNSAEFGRWPQIHVPPIHGTSV